MKIGVVGGTGNISASFVRLLLQQGHEVVCFNRRQSRKPPESVRVIQGDRNDREAFERAMQAEKFDAAIDMICFNKEEAESSLRAFRGVGHFVQCSTVCTYGVEYDWLPVSEDHPLRPITDYGRGKVEADQVFLEAHARESFPVTIIKPSTTYGPIMGLPRQTALELSWIDRIRKGKPIIVCGDGKAIFQALHVDDAALCFANVLGKRHCIGKTYNLTKKEFHSWEDYHRTAMKALGREVELVGVPLADLVALNVPGIGICRDIFAHNTLYDPSALFEDVPEFRPRISLEEGIRNVIEALDAEGRIPNSDGEGWEDRIIEAQRKVREVR